MFRKLHAHFVLTAMSLLSVVLVLSFGAIYASTAARLYNRPIQAAPIQITLPSEPFTGDIRSYIAAQRQADAERTLRDLAITLILTGAATLGVGYFVAQYLARRAIAPVEGAYDKQRQFIGDASHELKTPLAVIDANIEAEFAGKKKLSPWLKNIQDETARMNGLVNGLLSLAQLDETGRGIKTGTVDITALLKKAVKITQPLAKEKSLKLTQSIDAALAVSNDKDKLYQIIMILLDNAIKYTEKGGEVVVSGRAEGKQVEISISNSHREIPVEKLERLFERFYQADETHKDKGHGLGLAIAKELAKNCNITFSVSQRSNQIIFTLLI